jgi:hypothetical protein
MFRATVLWLSLPLFAVAAPVPKRTEADKIEAKFGKVVDPKGDSKFELDGDALKITLPAEEPRGFGYTHDPKGRADKKFDHTPRVEFTASGDFVLTVRVNTPLDEKAVAVSPGKACELGGGIRFTPKSGDWSRFGVMQSVKDRLRSTMFMLDSPGSFTNSGTGTGVSYDGFSGETVWLRATRAGEVVTREASTDGKTWREEKTTTCVLPDETVTISLYALHHSDKAHTVTFDQFRVEKPKK